MSAGMCGFAAISQGIVRGPTPDVLATLGVVRRPDESTLRRLFAVLCGALLDRLLGGWAATRTRTVERRRVYYGRAAIEL